MDIFAVISLLGCLAMFLYGMEIMGDGLKNNSDDTLKRVLEKLTHNALMGVLTGTLVTAVIQSSTATIVLTVGLIGAGILNLKQAVSIVLGANIGTTVTAQIIRLMDLETSGNIMLEFFKPSTLAPLAMIAGIILIMFIKKASTKGTGQILMGFGVLFMGLLGMTAAVQPLATSGAFLSVLQEATDIPLLGIAAGLILTVIVQSSSAMVGMLQALSSTGVMTFSLIYPVIMGINLGTCVTTAFVCSIGTSKDAKRTGIVHIVFNTIGTILFMIVMTLMHRMGAMPALWTKIVDSGDIANFQTLFNLITAIVLLPFTNQLVALSKKIIREDPEEEAEKKELSELAVLDEKLFISPAIALSQTSKGITRMGELVEKNLNRAFKQLQEYTPTRSEKVDTYEDRIDAFTDTAENYLIKLSRLIESPEDNRQLNLLLQAVTDFERIGDYANNLNHLGERKMREGVIFSEQAQKELEIIQAAVQEIVALTVQAFESGDSALAKKVEPLEEVIDDLVAMLKDGHVQRLKVGTCTVGAGLIFIEALTNIGRAADQCSSIAVFLLGRDDPQIMDNHHAYLRELHKGKDAAYATEMEKKRKQYLAPLQEL
ncbi:MAG: Na/Pi cotransporter family protein [Eubacteriales bacterium]|nr:Na/Pi cotransporter family protein [Eubacteriales bacterium]